MIPNSACITKIGKGKNSLPGYKAIIKRDIAVRNDFEEGDCVLIGIGNDEFPTIITKIWNKSGYFSYAFTVPRNVGLRLPTAINFELISKAVRPAKETKRHIDVSSFGLTSRKHKIYHFKTKHGILSWIYSRGCKPFLFPKHIPHRTSKHSLFEIAGAFFCEGLRAKKAGHNLDRLSFSNADPEQIEWFIDACDRILHLPKTAWKCQILYPDKMHARKLVSLWSGKGIDKNNIRIYKNQTVKAPYGVCIIYVSNTTLAEIFYQIFERCKKMALKDKKAALEFFRGVSRGDIGITGSGRVGGITFSTEEKDDAAYFAKICKILELNASELYFGGGCWNLAITGYQSFIKLLEMDAIKHNQRAARLRNGVAKSKKSVLFEYLKAIDEGARTSKALESAILRSQVTTTAYLRKWRNEGYLRPAQATKTGIEHVLTDKGKEALEKYEKLIGDMND